LRGALELGFKAEFVTGEPPRKSNVAGMIHPENAPAGSASPVPNVTIGAVRVSNRPTSSAGGPQHSP